MRRLWRKISPFNGDMSAFIPYYVTRPHGASGQTGAYSQSIWMTLLFQLLAWANGVLWGIYGLIQAAQHIL